METRNFNPRSRVGNDPDSGRYIVFDRYFNPRSRVGNDGIWMISGCFCQHFNPRSRVGNDCDAPDRTESVRNFNPRSRVGNDEYLVLLILKQKISIHVPAWGTTTTIIELSGSGYISIHVPAWGTTIETVPITSGSGDFNPRSRVGNDCCIQSTKIQDIRFQSTFPRGERRLCSVWMKGESIISIHVPAWGTTQASQKPTLCRLYFNPRSRVGNDE